MQRTHWRAQQDSRYTLNNFSALSPDSRAKKIRSALVVAEYVMFGSPLETMGSHWYSSNYLHGEKRSSGVIRTERDRTKSKWSCLAKYCWCIREDR